MGTAAGSCSAEQRKPDESSEITGPPEGQAPSEKQAEDDNSTEADFQCAACKELLLDPVVFTCGHAVCGGCLVPEGQPLGSCPQCDMPLVSRPRLCKLVSPILDPLTVDAFLSYSARHSSLALFLSMLHLIAILKFNMIYESTQYF